MAVKWTKDKVVNRFLSLCDGDKAPFAKEVRHMYYAIYRFFDGYQGICAALDKRPRYSKYYSIELDSSYYVVKSKLEVNTLIFLLCSDIDFDYERKILEGENYLYDFFLKEKQIYIECAGYKKKKEYLERMSFKRDFYKKNCLKMIEILPCSTIKKQYQELKSKIESNSSFQSFLDMKEKCKVKMLDAKYDESKYLPIFEEIYHDDITFKEIKEKYPELKRYIITNYDSYSDFLIKNSFSPKNHNPPRRNVDCVYEYRKIAREMGYNPSKSDILKDNAWLTGWIQREYGNSGEFFRQNRIIPASQEMRGISFRKDKQLTNPWRVRWTKDKVTKTIGHYPSLEEAIEVRDRVWFGE